MNLPRKRKSANRSRKSPSFARHRGTTNPLPSHSPLHSIILSPQTKKVRRNRERNWAQQLRQRNTYLRALHQTALTVMNHLNIDDLLKTIVSYATQLMGTKDGFIYLVDDQRSSITMRIGLGRPADSIGFSVKRGVGLVGKVWETGKPLVIDDYGAWGNRYTGYDKDEVRTVVGIPLKSGRRVSGVLGLGYNEKHSISAGAMAFLEQLAHLASIALENATLHGRLQTELLESKRTGERLALLSIAIEAANDSIIITDASLPVPRVEYVNAAFCRLSGYTPAEVIGRPASLAGRDTDAEEIARVRRATVEGVSFHAELLAYRKDGTSFWLDIAYEPIRDDNGTLVHWVCVQRETTSRREAEQALRESERRYRTLFENTNDAVIIYGLDLSIIAFNQQALDILGYTAEEMHELYITQFIAPEELDAAADRRARKLAGEHMPPYERTIITRSGERRIMEISTELVRDAQGNPLYHQSIAHDITARKRVEYALAESETRYRTISELTSDCIYYSIFTATGSMRVIWLTEGFTRLTGYTLAEVGERDDLEFYIHPDDRAALKRLLRSLFNEEKASQLEYRLITKSGQARWVLGYTKVVHKEGNSVHVLGTMSEITERKEHEQQLLYLAIHDPLTGLHNRRWLEERLAEVIAQAVADTNAVLLIDLDGFKAVNDTPGLGHAAGDEALKYIVHIISEALPATGATLARLGGDEFAVLLEGFTLNAAQALAERLRQVVADHPFAIADYCFDLTLSIGLVCIDPHQNVRTILFQADTAMYLAKKQGGNRLLVYRELPYLLPAHCLDKPAN